MTQPNYSKVMVVRPERLAFPFGWPGRAGGDIASIRLCHKSVSRKNIVINHSDQGSKQREQAGVPRPLFPVAGV